MNRYLETQALLLGIRTQYKFTDTKAAFMVYKEILPYYRKINFVINFLLVPFTSEISY